MKKYNTKSSGIVQDFDSGAKRDSRQGKGRFDLIPTHTIKEIARIYAVLGKNDVGFKNEILSSAIGSLYDCLGGVKDNVPEVIWKILEYMEIDGEFYEDLPRVEYGDVYNSSYRFDLIPYSAIKRIADIYERGGLLYGDRNWEKGIPLSRLLDSAIRHLFQCIAGKRDEDHAGQAAWNVIAFVEILWRIERGYLPHSLNDLPKLKCLEHRVSVVHDGYGIFFEDIRCVY
jgi:hypothetical protein